MQCFEFKINLGKQLKFNEGHEGRPVLIPLYNCVIAAGPGGMHETVNQML